MYEVTIGCRECESLYTIKVEQSPSMVAADDFTNDHRCIYCDSLSVDVIYD